jgi:putative component of membrane protein insertase Oxa1/YidC/SpoIIIJ protein YidD
MALNCFLKSAEPIKIYKVLVGAFAGNVGKYVGTCPENKPEFLEANPTLKSIL